MQHHFPLNKKKTKCCRISPSPELLRRHFVKGHLHISRSRNPSVVAATGKGQAGITGSELVLLFALNFIHI